jgi:8-oxo-dGTP diphosphatase
MATARKAAADKTTSTAPERNVRVDVVVVLLTAQDGRLKVLCLRQEKGVWALPKGTPGSSEKLITAVERVIKDQMGTSLDYIEQLYTFGNTIPRSGDRVIEVGYYGLIPAGSVEIPKSPETDLWWYDTEELPNLIGDHASVVKVARERLRGKLAYTAVGFELLGAEFTLTQLQKLYETILDRPLDKRNFRRKIDNMGIVEPTGRIWRNPRGRHAELWTFKPEVFEQIRPRTGDPLQF